MEEEKFEVEVAVVAEGEEEAAEEEQEDAAVVNAVETAPVEEEILTPHSELYPSFVRDLTEADEVLHRFENNTKSRFCVWRSPKDFGHAELNAKKKKVYWNEFSLEYRKKETLPNGTPFVLMGKKIFDCHHGKDRSLAMKRRAEQKRIEMNEKKKRTVTTPGKKINCPAQVVFTEVAIFPTYKMPSDSQYCRKQGSRVLKGDIRDDRVNKDKVDRRIYISLPSAQHHKGHEIGEGTESCERMHSKVAEKITELVNDGITGWKEMKRRLDIFVRTELCPELWKPCHTNRRYYPTKGVIRNKMYNSYIRKRLAIIDQSVIAEFVKDYQTKNEDNKLFFMPYADIDEVRLHAMTGISVEEELEDELKIRQQVAREHFCVVHQTDFQKQLLNRYGDHVCFLDPVYRTVKYPLPLYFVTVKTNVDYQVVAFFIIQDECCDSITEALTIIKAWNPDWKPKIFLADNDSEEILALEEVFQDCEVFISSYHRQQSWERWLAQPTNNMTSYKEAILNHLSLLTKADSNDKYKKALKLLEGSDLWGESYGQIFKDWFENTWLNVKERWVWAYISESFTNVLTTNNTFEWQSKYFTHERLHGHGIMFVSDIIKFLIETILPEKRDSYYELNSEINSISSKYTNLPDFFKNRPRCVIDHITERITSSYEISTDDITVDSFKVGEFLVNCRRSDFEYRLQFGNADRLPSCECEDWARNMLPCKHFVAVMRDFKEWSWAKFPESYRSSPYLTLDETLNPSSSPTANEEPEEKPASSEATVSVLDSSQFHELIIPKLSTKSKSGMCRELLNDINNFTYMLADDDVINRLNTSLERILTDMKLAFVDDEVVIEEELLEMAAKMEERVKRMNIQSTKKAAKRSIKQSTASPDKPAEGEEPPKKVAKVDVVQQQQPTTGATAATSQTAPANPNYVTTETIEEPVLEEMNHMEILNMDYYRSLNNDAAKTEANATEASKEGDVAVTAPPTEPDESGVDAALLELAQLEEKKGDTSGTDSRPPVSLPKYEARLVQRNEMLTVDSINMAQNLLHDMFPNLKGFQNVARGAIQAFEPISGDFIQILHDGNLHWVCTSNISLGATKDPAAVFMYDSYNQGYIAKFTKQQLASFLCIQSAEMKVVTKSVQQHNGVNDCGVYAIAFATALAFGQDPSKQRFDTGKMRLHLVECLKMKKMTPFPEQTNCSEVVLSKRKFYTIELFCSCRMPYEKPKSEADLMAQCGSCKEWFHQRCEKIALEIFKASGMNFFCSACLKKVQV